jgi:hypothetical protein
MINECSNKIIIINECTNKNHLKTTGKHKEITPRMVLYIPMIIIKLCIYYSLKYYHDFERLQIEFRFTDHLQIVTTSIYNTLQIATAHSKPSQSAFTNHFPLTDINNWDSSASLLASSLSQYPTTLLPARTTSSLHILS